MIKTSSFNSSSSLQMLILYFFTQLYVHFTVLCHFWFEKEGFQKRSPLTKWMLFTSYMQAIIHQRWALNANVGAVTAESRSRRGGLRRWWWGQGVILPTSGQVNDLSDLSARSKKRARERESGGVGGGENRNSGNSPELQNKANHCYSLPLQSLIVKYSDSLIMNVPPLVQSPHVLESNRTLCCTNANARRASDAAGTNGRFTQLCSSS